MNKNQTRLVLSDIRKILWEKWDPLGVNDMSQTFGEYDGYAGGLYTLLLRGATQTEIADHLRDIETGNMGLRVGGSSREYLGEVGGVLRAIDLEPPEAP